MLFRSVFASQAGRLPRNVVESLSLLANLPLINDAGFLAVLPVVPGVPHTICLWALSALADPQSWLGCRVA